MVNFSSPQEAVSWMEGLCMAYSTNPKEAEAALIDFRRSEHAVAVAKIILEHSQLPMAQFHAALTLQEAALVRWDSHPPAERQALKEFLWEFISREWARLDRSVASQCLRIFCVLWRRGWTVETMEAKHALFALLERTSKEGGASTLRSAKILHALVSEFGSTRATALGQTMEFLRQTHAAFDKFGLDQSLEMSMKLLGEVVNIMGNPEALADSGVMELVTTVVNACSEVLSWDFCFVEEWQIPPAQQLVRPGPRWRQYLVRPDFLGAVFGVYHKVRRRGTVGRGGTLPNSLRQLLLQLASVHGDIFEDDSQRQAYASFIVEGAMAVLASPLAPAGAVQSGVFRTAAQVASEEAQADEYIDIASMAVRLVGNFKLRMLAHLESFSGFVRQLAEIASRMLQESAVFAGQEDDSNIWRDEVFALLLEAWVTMAEDPEVRRGGDAGLREGMEELTFPLFEQYVAQELTVSRLEAEASCGREEDDEQEEIGAADKDEQMASVAILGRLSPARALATLDAQVRGISGVLGHLLETGTVNGQAALLPSGDLSPGATGVLEQARTVVVLAAHLMADKDEGEAMVPEVLHAVFLKENAAADRLVELVHSVSNLLELHVTLLCGGSAGANVNGVSGKSPGVQGALGGGSAGDRGDGLSPSPLLSPYLGAALLWCFARWASAYLFPDLRLYEAGLYSHRLTVAFGVSASSAPLLDQQQSNVGGGVTGGTGMGAVNGSGSGGHGVQHGRGGLVMAETLLRACWTCLSRWPSQPDVCTNALDLMGTLASPTKAPSTTSLPLWWEIVAAYGAGGSGGSPGGIRRLSADMQGTLVQRLCEGSLNRSDNTAAAKDGFEKVSRPVWNRLSDLLHAVGGMRGTQRQSPRVVAETLLCVRLCRGVVLGCGGGAHHDLGEAFVELTYNGMTMLLTIHVSGEQSVVHEVLQYFRDIAEHQLVYMSSGRAMALYEACGGVLKIYTTQNAGRIRKVDPTAEEEAYDDVLCVLQLLNHLVTKDLVDQSDDDSSGKDRNVVTDVVFFGLKKVMPLMTEGLLEYPLLASQYFSLVGFMVQTYPHKLPEVDFEVFEQIVNSLVFCSQQANAPVARNSLQAIEMMVAYHVREKMKAGEGLSTHLAQKPDLFVIILKSLLEMLVLQQFVWDRLEACSVAILPLLVCEQEGFRRLAEEIVLSRPESTRPGLIKAFQDLHVCHASCGAGADRAGRRRFQEGVREFVTSVRSFFPAEQAPGRERR